MARRSDWPVWLGRPDWLGSPDWLICQIGSEGQIGQFGWEGQIGWETRWVGLRGQIRTIKKKFKMIKAKKIGEIGEIGLEPDWLGGQIGWEARLDYTLSFTYSIIVHCPLID